MFTLSSINPYVYLYPRDINDDTIIQLNRCMKLTTVVGEPRKSVCSGSYFILLFTRAILLGVDTARRLGSCRQVFVQWARSTVL